MSDDFSSLPPASDNPYAAPTTAAGKPAPSSQRRDGLILGLGIGAIGTTVIGAMLGFVCCLFWPIAGVGLILGIVAGILGMIDLKAIREGRLDPQAASQTKVGMILGFASVALIVLAIVGIILLAVIVGISEGAATGFNEF